MLFQSVTTTVNETLPRSSQSTVAGVITTDSIPQLSNELFSTIAGVRVVEPLDPKAIIGAVKNCMVGNVVSTTVTENEA